MSNQPIHMRRRHCMVVHAYYPIGEARVEREAMALLERGYAVDVICLRMEGEPKEQVIDGVKIYRLPVKRHRGKGLIVQTAEYLAFFALVFIRLFTLQSRQKYGTVQVHNLPDFLVFSALVSKIRGAKILLDLHDLMPEFYAGKLQAGMDSWPVRLLIGQENLACAFADHVITVTELWRRTLIRRGVPPEKVSVVMNVADSRVFQKNGHGSPGEDRREGEFRLIYHGTLAERYGVDLLVQAVDRLRETIPGIHLTVHGKGEFFDELQGMVTERGLEDHVRFSTQYVPIAELPKLILQADLAVVPYRRNIFTDGILPTKLMESVALGVPVIAARTPIISEYFDDTMVQFFTPEDVESLCEGILSLYRDPDRLASLAKNADRFSQTHSWESVAADYADLVDRLYDRD